MIVFESVPTNARASGVFVEEKNVVRSFASLIAPQILLIFGQYNSGKSPTDNVPQLITSLEDAWNRYGRGSLLSRLIAKALSGSRGQVDIYAVPLAEIGGGAFAAGKITVSGTASANGVLSVAIGDDIYELAVASGATAASVMTALANLINANLDSMFTANYASPDVDVTCRHRGAFGNDVNILVSPKAKDVVPAGLTVTITQIASGASNPTIATAMGNLGDRFYTAIVCPYNDSTNTGLLRTNWITRASASVKKPYMAFVGFDLTRANYLTELDNHNTQSTCTLPTFEILLTPGFELAAEVAGEFARQQLSAPNKPIRNTVLRAAKTRPGFINLTWEQKNQLVNAGGSWFSISEDGSVVLGDICTSRTRTDAGAESYDWLFVETMANLQTKIYSLDQVFSSGKYESAIVVADTDVSNLPYAVRPRTAKQDVIKLIDELWIPFGLSKQRDDIVKNIQSNINTGNASRIDVLVPDIMAAGLRIVAARYEWAFQGGN